MAGPKQKYNRYTFQDSVLNLRTRIFNRCGEIWILNTMSQTIFIFGLVGISNFGIFIALPYLYHDYGPEAVLCIRIVGSFLAFQMIINWLCMRLVKSGYQPDRHGGLPDGVKMEEVINQEKDQHPGNGSENGAKSHISSSDLRKRNVMYVASEMPKTQNEQPKRTAYPYFSWTPCLRCNRPRPPRCHHCPICRQCVLKRDHHCYFTGTCVGFRNLRHFAVFLFWASIATTFAMIHAVPYYYYHVMNGTMFVDWLFPLAIVRAILGFIEWQSALFILLTWILVAFLYWATSYLYIVTKLIRDGKTTFEVEFKMEVTDTRCLKDKLASVFGHYWLLNYIVPLHFIFKPIDDPVRWPHIRA